MPPALPPMTLKRERRVQAVRRIIAELEAAGYLCKQKVGRVNQYRVNLDLPLRRPEVRATAVGELLRVLKLSRSRKA